MLFLMIVTEIFVSFIHCSSSKQNGGYILQKILNEMTGDVCLVSDNLYHLHKKLMVNEKVRTVLKFDLSLKFNKLHSCSSIILHQKKGNNSEILQYIQNNLKAPGLKVLLLKDKFSELELEYFHEISWERNLNILISVIKARIFDLLTVGDEEKYENMTIHSVMLKKKLFPCSSKNLDCLSKISFGTNVWNPVKMLENLNRSFVVSGSAHRPYFGKKGNNFKGIDFELVKLMVPNWPVTFKIFPEKYTPDDRVKYEIIIEFLNTVNDADISIGGLWLTDDFPSTHPYAKQCNTFLVHRPSLLPDSTFIVQYFRAPLWGTYFVFLLFMSFLLKLSLMFHDVEYSFDYCLLLIIHFVANLGIPKFPDKTHFYPRYFLTIWMIFCLLMTTYFCVGLTVTLRYPRFTSAINNWRDMVDLEMKWIENTKFYRDRLSEWGVYDTYLKNLSDLFQYEEDIDLINENLKKNYAVRVQKLPGFYLTNTGWMDEYAKKNYKLLKDCFLIWYNAFLLKNTTPFLEYFNKKTLEVVEFGFVSYWYQHHTNRKKNRYMMMFFNEYSDEYVQFIKFDKLKSCLLLLSCGLLLSLFVFLIELFIRR